MTNEELILQMLAEMKHDVNERLTRIEQKQDDHSETLQDIKTAVNTMIDWAEDVGRFTKIPFAKD